jgi:DNA-binding transcriptional LysR family regulator
VSGQIARLEAQLGSDLFHRGARGVSPTEAGTAFLAIAEDVLRRLEDGAIALSALRGAEVGTLRIGGGATATTWLLPPLLRRYLALHPGIHITVRERGTTDVVGLVLSGELDLGLVTLPVVHPHLRATPWVDDVLRLLAPPGHALASSRTFRWEELARVPLVLFEAGSAVRRGIDEALARAGVTPHVVMELRSIEAIKRMVEAGIGAGFVSRHALRPDEGADPAEGPLSRTLAVVWRSDRPPSAATRAFLELLVPRRAR